ncbi:MULTISPECIES: hypothetical protein [unclassified Chelatococcus]|nr:MULTISPECIES: hypothetical protein [unclassified Chelatococcus]MBS7737812.1 hypothetical protein [Chelatococcus sp. HY11]MCO5079267.1 hypothetical protein [Chelatococcus sp.]CAH1666046.1 hypothetical protein CHELA41_22765 [Hyphomicrobiales bacterium]CAH1680923.1 hypothetical protein CHELA20_52155 [Hyphomicrobiales bacterium]
MDLETVRWQLKWADRAIRNSEMRIARLIELRETLRQRGCDQKKVDLAIQREEKEQATHRMDQSRLAAMVVHFEQQMSVRRAV